MGTLDPQRSGEFLWARRLLPALVENTLSPPALRPVLCSLCSTERGFRSLNDSPQPVVCQLANTVCGVVV